MYKHGEKLVMLQLSKETSPIKEIAALKPYATQSRKKKTIQI